MFIFFSVRYTLAESADPDMTAFQEGSVLKGSIPFIVLHLYSHEEFFTEGPFNLPSFLFN